VSFALEKTRTPGSPEAGSVCLSLSRSLSLSYQSQERQPKTKAVKSSGREKKRVSFVAPASVSASASAAAAAAAAGRPGTTGRECLTRRRLPGVPVRAAGGGARVGNESLGNHE
jgi:hypothetical protein